MADSKKSCKKKIAPRGRKPHDQSASSIITVRISDTEKQRVDEIMMNLDLKHYSDVMRMALQMVIPDIGYIQEHMQ
jgi:hypothetical protein